MQWITKEGHKIAISDLSDSHLVNILSWLCRTVESAKTKALIDGYSAMNYINGEMAEMQIERELFAIEQMTLAEFLEEAVPQWRDLLREVNYRNLSHLVHWNGVQPVFPQWPDQPEERKDEDMYFVIGQTEDGEAYVHTYGSRKALMEAMTPERDCLSPNVNPNTAMDEAELESDIAYWGDKVLIIKGKVVKPAAKEAVTVWEID